MTLENGTPPPDRRIYFDPIVTASTTYSVRKGEKAKDALAKIAQLVPGEILGAYGAALGTLPLFSAAQQVWVGLICFLLGILGTAWYVGWRIGPGIRKQKHLLVYMGAFAIWAYSLTGKTVLPWIFHPGIAALLPVIGGVIAYKIKLPMKEER
jgi:hypothetical protein